MSLYTGLSNGWQALSLLICVRRLLLAPGPLEIRSLELSAEAPAGGVLLLHGMSDSPYSLRAPGAHQRMHGELVIFQSAVFGNAQDAIGEL